MALSERMRASCNMCRSLHMKCDGLRGEVPGEASECCSLCHRRDIPCIFTLCLKPGPHNDLKRLREAAPEEEPPVYLDSPRASPLTGSPRSENNDDDDDDHSDYENDLFRTYHSLQRMDEYAEFLIALHECAETAIS